MKIPKPSIPALKVDPATVQKVGVAAVGLGSALLIAADPKLRRRLATELTKQLEALKTDETAPQSATPKSAPSPAPAKPTNRGETVAGVVYLLKAGPFFKIGKAMNFEQRLRQIKLQLPYPIEVVHVMKASDISHVESYWHRRFASRRQNGEWFVLTDGEVAEFKGFAKM